MKEFIKKLIGRLEEISVENTCSDCPYKAKCDEVQEHINDETTDLCGATIKALSIEIVNQLAEEYNNGWISANDRLPEENGKYIVYYRKWTFGNYLPKFDEKEIRILRYSTNGWFFPTYGDVEAEKDIHREVIAWQPLPEPYTQKGVINGTE